jgi:hypothetical protein
MVVDWAIGLHFYFAEPDSIACGNRHLFIDGKYYRFGLQPIDSVYYCRNC